uniref:Uncharacterized protein n=1 Tax=Vitis vinifera TaxID=29760 RepID=F6HEQ8_VITVI
MSQFGPNSIAVNLQGECKWQFIYPRDVEEICCTFPKANVPLNVLLMKVFNSRV